MHLVNILCCLILCVIHIFNLAFYVFILCLCVYVMHAIDMHLIKHDLPTYLLTSMFFRFVRLCSQTFMYLGLMENVEMNSARVILKICNPVRFYCKPNSGHHCSFLKTVMASKSHSNNNITEPKRLVFLVKSGAGTDSRCQPYIFCRDSMVFSRCFRVCCNLVFSSSLACQIHKVQRRTLVSPTLARRATQKT